MESESDQILPTRYSCFSTTDHSNLGETDRIIKSSPLAKHKSDQMGGLEISTDQSREYTLTSKKR